MNCPKCGMQTLPEQKYCRSCGAGLQIVTQPLAERVAVSDVTRTPAVVRKDETQRAAGMMRWGFILMFIGVSIGVTGKMLMHEDIVVVVGVLLSLVGMFLTVYPYLSPSPRKQYDSRLPSPPEVLTESPPTKYLPQVSDTEYVPSITERTTGLLESSAPITPRKKEGE